MSRSRKEVLADALKAEIGAASVDLKTLFTDDVTGWSPYVTLSGLPALADLAALREAAFSNVVITFRGIDEVGNKAFAEWLVEADHTGRSCSATIPRWKQRDGTSSCPASPWPTSVRGRSGHSGRTSMTCR